MRISYFFSLIFVSMFFLSDQVIAKQDSSNHSHPTYRSPDLANLYKPLAQELNKGGLLIYFVPLSTSGRDQVEIDQWWKQCPLSRTISDLGIAQGKTISRAIQNLGIRIGHVESSELCIALTSATLILSNPSIRIYSSPLLNPYEIQKKIEPSDETLKAAIGALFQTNFEGEVVIHVGFPLPPTVVNPVIAELLPGDSAIFRVNAGNPELVARLTSKQWDEMSSYITYLALKAAKAKKRNTR